MKKTLIYIYVAILSLATVPALYPGGGPIAHAASMNWYFTDGTTSIPSGATYWMNRTTGSGSSDLAFATNDAHIWVSDETASTSSDMSGVWSVVITTTAWQGGAKIDVEVGELSGGTFTSRGATTGTRNLGIGTTAIDVTTTSHTIAVGDYIAVRISSSAKSFTVDLTGTDSPTYASSPTGAPDFPGAAELINFTVTDNGLTTGITFGPVDRNSTDSAEAEQTGSSGAVTLIVGSDTNVAVSIDVQGTDFTPGTYTLANADVQYDDDQTLDQGTDSGLYAQGTLGTSYSTWYTLNAGTASTVETYLWITVPSTQLAGTYTSTFSFRCIAQ